MKSLKFPKLFNSNSTRVWTSSEYAMATGQNIRLLLNCAREELLGDPYFGVTIKQFMFDPNSPVLRDIITDIIYTQLAIFIPQVKIRREDIYVYVDRKGSLQCTFSCISQLDYQTLSYNLTLLEGIK
jgi:phage baseplate assembly protein W